MKGLDGEKVSLRAVEPEDLEVLMRWENDAENWEISGTLMPFSKDLMKKYIENAHLNIFQTGQYRFMIETATDKITIGTADVFDFDPYHKRAGVGILIGQKEHRNNGYATEAIELLKSYCFNHLELHQLYCNILAGNEASISLFEKADFLHSGTKRNWIRAGKIFKDQLFLQLINPEYS